MSEYESIEAVKVQSIDDLIKELSCFRDKHGNMPVFYNDDMQHTEICTFSIAAETGNDEILNENLPRRLVIS